MGTVGNALIGAKSKFSGKLARRDTLPGHLSLSREGLSRARDD